MKINTLAIIAFTALCAHHNAHAMLCISKLRSFAPIYMQTRYYYRQIGDPVDLANAATSAEKGKIAAATQNQQNKLASQRRELLQGRLDELQANLKNEDETIQKMNVKAEKNWQEYSYNWCYLSSFLLLVNSNNKNRKLDIEKEIFNIKMLLLKDA
jgi:hypothetical protein